MNHFTDTLGLSRYTMYMQDYGGPVGFRMALAHPDRIEALIVQNAVAHNEGLGATGRLGARSGPIAPPTRARSAPISSRCPRRGPGTSGTIPMSSATTRISGATNAPFSISRVKPTFKATSSTTTAPTSTRTPRGRPGCRSASLRFWSSGGKHDLLFELSEPEAYRRDVPAAQVHVLDAGHFALDTAANEIAGLVRDFMERSSPSSSITHAQSFA